MVDTLVLAGCVCGIVAIDGVDDSADGVVVVMVVVIGLNVVWLADAVGVGESGSLLLPVVPMLCTLSRWRV